MAWEGLMGLGKCLQNRCSTAELTRQINALEGKSSRFVLTASPRPSAIPEEGRRSHFWMLKSGPRLVRADRAKIFLWWGEPPTGLAVRMMGRALLPSGGGMRGYVVRSIPHGCQRRQRAGMQFHEFPLAACAAPFLA